MSSDDQTHGQEIRNKSVAGDERRRRTYRTPHSPMPITPIPRWDITIIKYLFSVYHYSRSSDFTQNEKLPLFTIINNNQHVKRWTIIKFLFFFFFFIDKLLRICRQNARSKIDVTYYLQGFQRHDKTEL